jgi:hypothetical protein
VDRQRSNLAAVRKGAAAGPWREDVAVALAANLEKTFGGWKCRPRFSRQAFQDAFKVGKGAPAALPTVTPERT